MGSSWNLSSTVFSFSWVICNLPHACVVQGSARGLGRVDMWSLGSPNMSFSFLDFPLHFPETVATFSSFSDSSGQKDGRFPLIPSASLYHTITWPTLRTKLQQNRKFTLFWSLLPNFSSYLKSACVASPELWGIFYLLCILPEIYRCCFWRLVCFVFTMSYQKQNSRECSTTSINNCCLYH